MKFEISLPQIPWKRAAIGAGLVALVLYWWLGVRPYLHLKEASLRAATFELHAAGPGVLSAKIWEEGDLFQKGEMLGILSSEPANKDLGAQLQASKELLAQERVTLEETMQAYIRAQVEGQPSEVIDQILLRVQRTQQSLASAEEEIAQFEGQKSQEIATQQAVLAPFDGMILRALKQNGQWAAVGEPVFSVCDRSRLWVEVMIPEEWLGKLNLGMVATVSFPSFAGRRWEAKIERISPVIEQGRVRVRLVAAELPLSPGLSAEVTLRVR